MTNKEYKTARDAHENAYELDTFVSYVGYFGYPNRYMKQEDIKEMREEYKEIKADKNAFALDGFGGRALIIPIEGGYILQSYYTKVAVIRDGVFYKTWDGYSNTTLKHINTFRKWAGFPGISKRDWIEMRNEWKV